MKEKLRWIVENLKAIPIFIVVLIAINFFGFTIEED